MSISKAASLVAGLTLCRLYNAPKIFLYFDSSMLKLFSNNTHHITIPALSFVHIAQIKTFFF